jgi:hypothetical protein
VCFLKVIGRELKRFEFEGRDQIEIDIGWLSEGSYFLIITNEYSVAPKKLIIQK